MPAITQASKKYNLSDNATLLKSYLNLIYGVDGKILQLTPKDYKSEDELLLEVSWIEYLNNNGFEVVEVVRSNQGKQVESVNDYHVICYEKIIGSKADHQTWSSDYFEKLGSYIGKLHNLGKAFENENNLDVKNWDELPKCQFVDLLPEDDRELKKLYSFLMKRFSSYEVNDENYGIVHYDIHQGNYFLRGENEELILFDFEMTCTSWYINDIAIILYYILISVEPKDHKALTQLFLESFFLGYRRERDIDESDKSKISSFLMYRDLLVYGYTFRMWKTEADMNEGARDFRIKLESSIDRRMKEFNFR